MQNHTDSQFDETHFVCFYIDIAVTIEDRSLTLLHTPGRYPGLSRAQAGNPQSSIPSSTHTHTHTFKVTTCTSRDEMSVCSYHRHSSTAPATQVYSAGLTASLKYCAGVSASSMCHAPARCCVYLAGLQGGPPGLACVRDTQWSLHYLRACFASYTLLIDQPTFCHGRKSTALRSRLWIM